MSSWNLKSRCNSCTFGNDIAIITLDEPLEFRVWIENMSNCSTCRTRRLDLLHRLGYNKQDNLSFLFPGYLYGKSIYHIEKRIFSPLSFKNPLYLAHCI